MANIILADNKISLSIVFVASELNVDLAEFTARVKKHFGYSKDYLTILDLFGIWSRCIYKDFDIAIDFAELLDELINSSLVSDEDRVNFTWIRSGILYELANNWALASTEIGEIHPYFRRNYADLIPGSTLVKVVARGKKRPDFLVSIEGIIYPVECKIEFMSAGKKQLEGYMKRWNVEKGYAVAKKLICKLPKNIVFLQVPC